MGDFRALTRQGNELFARNEYGAYRFEWHEDGSLDLLAVFPGRLGTGGYYHNDTLVVLYSGGVEDSSGYIWIDGYGLEDTTLEYHQFVPRRILPFSLNNRFYVSAALINNLVYTGIYRLDDLFNPTLVDTIPGSFEKYTLSDSVLYGLHVETTDSSLGTVYVFNLDENDSLVYGGSIILPAHEPEQDHHDQNAQSIICVGQRLLVHFCYEPEGWDFIPAIQLYDLADDPLSPAYITTVDFEEEPELVTRRTNSHAVIGDSVVVIRGDLHTITSLTGFEQDTVIVRDTLNLRLGMTIHCQYQPLPVFGSSVYVRSQGNILQLDASDPSNLQLIDNHLWFRKGIDAITSNNRLLIRQAYDAMDHRGISLWDLNSGDPNLLFNGFDIQENGLRVTNTWFLQDSLVFVDSDYTPDSLLIIDYDGNNDTFNTNVSHVSRRVKHIGETLSNNIAAMSFSAIIDTNMYYYNSYYLDRPFLELLPMNEEYVDDSWYLKDINHGVAYWEGPGGRLYVSTDPVNLMVNSFIETNLHVDFTNYFKALGTNSYGYHYTFFHVNPRYYCRVMNCEDPVHPYIVADLRLGSTHGYYPLDSTHVLTTDSPDRNMHIWRVAPEGESEIVASITRTTYNGAIGAIMHGDTIFVCDGYVMSTFILEEDTTQFVRERPSELPTNAVLHPVYPNPFNSTTRITVTLGTRSTTSLAIYNLLGQRVATLMRENEVEAGEHHLHWNSLSDQGTPVSSGVYFIRLEVKDDVQVEKLTLLR